MIDKYMLIFGIIVILCITCLAAIGGYTKDQKEIGFAKLGLEECSNNLWQKECK